MVCPLLNSQKWFYCTSEFCHDIASSFKKRGGYIMHIGKAQIINNFWNRHKSKYLEINNFRNSTICITTKTTSPNVHDYLVALWFMVPCILTSHLRDRGAVSWYLPLFSIHANNIHQYRQTDYCLNVVLYCRVQSFLHVWIGNTVDVCHHDTCVG